MALGFQKRIRISKNITLNLGKESASVRVGVKNAGITAGTKGTTVSASIAGTGVSARKKLGTTPKTTPQTTRTTAAKIIGSALSFCLFAALLYIITRAAIWALSAP